jgi:hypothetical protein
MTARKAIEPEEFRQVMRAAKACSGRSRGFGTRRRPSRGFFRRALWLLWETGCRTSDMRAMVVVEQPAPRRFVRVVRLSLMGGGA